METKQKHIAQELEISPSYLCLIFKGDKPISWPLAERLSKIFPEKSILQWRKAKPAQIKKAFMKRVAA